MRVEFPNTLNSTIYKLIYYVDSDYVTFEGYEMFNFNEGEFQPVKQIQEIKYLLNTKSHQEIAKSIAQGK